MNSRIAVAQLDVRVGDIDYNLKRHIEYADEAKANDARIVIFPELSLTGYSLRDLVHEVTQLSYRHHPHFEKLLELSKTIHIITGGVELTPRGKIHNAVMLFADGEMKIVHRKIYLPTYGMFEENRYFLPGESVRSFETPGGRWGTLICEDIWHLSLPYLLAQDGADVIVAIAAGPTRLGGDTTGKPAIANVNLEHHRTYARLLSCYFIFCNRVGFEDGISFWGGSTIISPMGTTIEQAPFFDDAMIYCNILHEEIVRARRESRHALDERPEFVLKELKRITRK